ncbi:YeeE/YedE thiosulfate transporter family protein [Halanaerobaculum tunisiense]
MNGKLESPKTDKKEKKIINLLLERPWPYWVGGVLVAVINIIYLLLTGKCWAITTGLARWGAWCLQILGFDIQQWSAWNYYDYIHPIYDRYTYSNLGIILGSLIAILLARQFRFKAIKNKKQLFLGLVGGWLMGYGARIAIGCNIGGLYSAISSLAINGWLYLPFCLIGIYLGSKILNKWFV